MGFGSISMIFYLISSLGYNSGYFCTRTAKSIQYADMMISLIASSKLKSFTTQKGIIKELMDMPFLSLQKKLKTLRAKSKRDRD
jgi:hypothetical protein